MLGDFDADRDTDILSGSYPGELYLFRRGPDGSFEDREQLLDRDGKPVKADRASTVFPADWDADGDLDLILGSIRGSVFLVENEGNKGEPAFVAPVQLELESDSTDRPSNSGPIVADWDDDGLPDLMVGMGDGSVIWYRNTGVADKPEFAKGKTIVEKSPFGLRYENSKPGQWGARVKICATDFDGDGRLDLLLGDRSGSVTPRELTEEEQETLDSVTARLSELVKMRSKATQELLALRRKSLDSEIANTEENQQQSESQAKELRALQDRLQKLILEYNTCNLTIRDLGPVKTRHGFVWLFLRKAQAE